jgi:Alpha/beta hydrolase family
VPGLVPAGAELAAIRQPVLMVYGTADPLGSVDGWRRFAGRLPHGELEVVDGGGHLPWYDDADQVAQRRALYISELEHNLERRDPAAAPETDGGTMSVADAAPAGTGDVNGPCWRWGWPGGWSAGPRSRPGWTTSTRRRLLRTAAGT